MSLSKQIVLLEKQIEHANAENTRLRSGDNVKVELNKYKAKLHDRDGAIATLVKSSKLRGANNESRLTQVEEELEDAEDTTEEYTI